MAKARSPKDRGAVAINRRSMSTQVADAMRDMVLTGVLTPGEAVTHEQLSSMLGVSTMPVREALLRLSHEGFIEGAENRSFRVAVTTRQDIRDAYWVHEVISGELAARATERVDADQVQALRDLAKEKPQDDSPNPCWRFHGLVNEAAASPRLTAVLRQVNRHVPEHYYKRSPTWQRKTTKSHKVIADALAEGDAAKAREAMAEHVRDAADFLIQYFSEHGFWQEPTADV